jgi:NAD-dependent deacetylase
MDAAYPEFLLATQNVDGLHPRAGSRRLVELHGNIHRARCTRCERVCDLPDAPGEEDDPLPECEECGGLLRPHIVWFGESYRPGILEEALSFAEHADVVIVAGTSARVWPPIAIALHAKSRGAVMIDVNPEVTEVSAQADAHLKGPAGEMLPALWAEVVARRA